MLFRSGEDAHVAWREALWAEIRRTVKEVWAAAGRPREVMLAVDGVVPMAKIRQQRVRRFKSAWLRGVGGEVDAWDQNAITPGTEFMDRLGIMLKEMCRQEGSGWSVSGADEPGEGEHKIMARLRLRGTSASASALTIVYGLDADLILLCMLTEAKTGTPLMLIRETQEFEGGGGSGRAAPEGYTFLNIGEVRRRLGLTTEESVVNYVGLMSLMGNDFLPHSLTYKLNDDGHEAVLEVMRGAPLVGQGQGEAGRWVIDVARFKEICAGWAGDEQLRFVQMIQKKKQQARRGIQKGMDESEALPLQWNVEAIFEDNGQLRADWRDTYWSFIHSGSDRDSLCHEYVRGLQWILDYYTGQPIDLQWLFPAWIPPLWNDFAGVDVGRSLEISAGGTAPIQPQEQLAMVLPVESWSLIRDRRLRAAPRMAPQFWPRKFGFFSFGRTWLWQCEARVPVLMVERLRAVTTQ